MGIFATFGKAISSAFAGGAKTTPVTKPSGGDGVLAYGGYLTSGERSPLMQGSKKWLTYTNALNYPTIATWVHYFTGLLAGTEWHAEPNPRGGADADRAVEIIEQGLLKAQLPTPWQSVVGVASMAEGLGFSAHEWTVKRRAEDGMMVFADIAHRPQHTIDRWDKPSEQEPWQAIGQLTQAGNRYVIPRSRLFYVKSMLGDSPDGVGKLRHVVELVRQLEVLESLEGHAYQTDLRGMPMIRVPLSELRTLAGTKGCNTEDEIKAFVFNATANIREIAANSAKTPDKIPYILFDSEPFKGADPNVFTSVLRWTFELIKGETNGLPDVNVLIVRKQTEISRVFGTEFSMMGNDGGAYAMHGDKTGVFATHVQNALTRLAAAATNDLARPLVALNGLDPETCTPTLVAEPISMDAIQVVCTSLGALAQSNLPPTWDGWNVILKRMHLPPMPEMTPEMMGILGGRGAPTMDPATGLPVDPAADPTAAEASTPPADLGSKDGKAAA